MATRLAAMVLIVGSLSLIVATAVGLEAGQRLGRRLVSDALVLQRTAGANEVAAQVRSYESLAARLAGGPTAVDAVDGFSAAFGELYDVPEAETSAQERALLEVYEERYVAPLRARGDTVQLSDFLAEDAAAIYLQAAYSLTQPPITDAIAVDDAGDGSRWSEVHVLVHPTFRNAVQAAGLLDVYVIEADTDRVLYTAAKRPDLGTSLAVGPYSGSVVARVSDAALQSTGGVASDINFYRGVPGVPIGAAAAAIRRGDRVLGTVVLTYDAAIYTERLTAIYGATGSEARSGSLYMLGAADDTTRSDPQSYQADPTAFVTESAAYGLLTPAQQGEIDRNGTTVLVQPAVETTANAAKDGDTTVQAGTSMTGADVVTTVARVPHDDLDWYVVSEVSAADADSTVATFRRILLVGTAIFVVVLAFVAVAWARRIMYPVRLISDRLGRAAVLQASGTPPEPLRIPQRSPIEMHRLADSFSAMGTALSHQREELRAARADRLDVLESMLPPAVAQRIARGEIDSLDEVHSASVVVVVVLGLGALVGADSTSDDRLLLDDLHADLDDIANEHGLDRIKVVGDSYFAACGHDRPYMDHTPRAVAFAEHVARSVSSVSRRTTTPLDTAIGVSTGPVTVGVSAGSRLVYDVWGPTVTTAHDLARAARAGEIVVSAEVKGRLPEEIELAPYRTGIGGGATDADRVSWVVVTDRTSEDPAPSEETS